MINRFLEGILQPLHCLGWGAPRCHGLQYIGFLQGPSINDITVFWGEGEFAKKSDQKMMEGGEGLSKSD